MISAAECLQDEIPSTLRLHEDIAVSYDRIEIWKGFWGEKKRTALHLLVTIQWHNTRVCY